MTMFGGAAVAFHVLGWVVALLLSRAVLIDGATFLAAQQGDAAALAKLVPAPGARRLLTGQDALREAFAQGSPEILRLLVAAGVETNSLLVQQVSQSRFLNFFPGETDWKGLSGAWQEPSCPKAFQAALRDQTGGPSGTIAVAGEAEFLAALSEVLGNDEVYADPAVGFKAMSLPAWMKETPSPGWNNSPLVRRVNWAILESLYPHALPSLDRGKGTSMLRFLAREALDKRGEGGRAALRAAYYDRNVEVLEMLVKEGFSLEGLQGEFRRSSFLDVPEDRHLRAYLEGQGMRPTEE